jgi:hypothetical protein
VNRPTFALQVTKEENGRTIDCLTEIIDVLNRIVQWVEVLRTKDDIEQIKTKVLFEIIDGFQV